MERSHPLLDRLEAPRPAPPSLRDISLSMLRLHWQAVRDVGDAPYALLKSLLPLSNAAQLADIEDNSPHIVPHTNGIWRQICVQEFIEIRKAVEDGRISKKDEPSSWREQYQLEEIKREEKMQAIVSKMRGQINDYKTGRATTKVVDWRLEKRRKTAAASSSAPARPKTLMEKARHNSKVIKSIYAPRRRPAPAPTSAHTTTTKTTPSSNNAASRPTSASFSTTSRTPSAAATTSLSSPRKRPRESSIGSASLPGTILATTTTTVKRAAPKAGDPADAAPAAMDKKARTGMSPPLASVGTGGRMGNSAKVASTPPPSSRPKPGGGGPPSARSKQSPPPPPPSLAPLPKAASPARHPPPPHPPPFASASTAPSPTPPPSIGGRGLAPMLPPPASNRPMAVPRGIFMPKKR
ncbi:hypothetical protein JCM10908_004417 [Rhodotorula pacifica]|uniref:elongin A domain-containing protein n=1 Tax=Rhodotorula pacifica TaxID=1495444 RepID=UPI00317F290A